MNLANPETHYMAIVDRIRAAGLTVGEATAAGLAAPYIVVFLMPSDGPSGPVGAHQDDERMSFQTTCVHDSARGVEWLKAKVREAVYGIAVTGRRVHVTRDLEFQTAIDRDIEPPLFRGGDRWTVWTTPA